MLKRGFTLIELLIAVLISSIVIIAAYALLSGTTKNFDEENDIVLLRQNLRNAEMLMQRDIGRIGFRTSYFQVNGGSNANAISDASFQVLRLARVTHNNKYFSQMTIVGDITDYGYFYIDRVNGNTVNFNATVLTAMQNNDCLLKASGDSTGNAVKSLMCAVGFCNNCVNGDSEGDNASGRFKESFTQAFSDADGVMFTSSANGDSAIRKYATGSSVNVEQMTVTLNNAALPPEQGYAALCINDKITPISAFTYTVLENSEDIGGSPQYDLVRCTHNIDFVHDSLHVKNCAIVLRNIAYFDVFPVKKGTSMVDLADEISQVPPDGNYNGATVGANFPINELMGVSFRIGIYSDDPAKDSSQIDVTANNAAYNKPYFQDANGLWHRMDHVQGSASIYTRGSLPDGFSNVAQVQVSDALVF